MGLIDWYANFNETVFLKKDSELENKIKVLEEIKNDGFSSETLEKDLLIAKLGLKGEQEIEFELRHANIGMYVLHDINLKYEDLSAQIDYIIVTRAKIYFVECKNLIGDITINERGDFIRQYQYKNKNIREGIYSPLTQAERHIEVYHKLWSLTNNGIFSNVREKQFYLWRVPLVVTANSKNILKTNFAPKDIKKYVIRSDQLIRYLQNDINNMNKDSLFSEGEMRHIAEKILSYHQSIEIDYKNIYKLSNNFTDTNQQKNDYFQLSKIKLLELRKKRSKEMNIPAYYVFTNEELESILALKPQSIEDLKKILPSVKVSTHGKEIIKIINDNYIDVI